MKRRKNNPKSNRTKWSQYSDLVAYVGWQKIPKKDLKVLVEEMGIKFVDDPIEQLILISKKADVFPETKKEGHCGADL